MPDKLVIQMPGYLKINALFPSDHHFHYGYLIYAAAVVANFDYEWGRKYFEEVLLLIRDIANPSTHDNFFREFSCLISWSFKCLVI